MEDLMSSEGAARVQKYMKQIQNTAAVSVQSMLRRISIDRGLKPKDSLFAEDFMDNGLRIKLTLTIDRDRGTAEFDFAGTSAEVYGNLNAPRSVVTSAVIYTLRSLVDTNIPLNQGCLEPVSILLPKGSMLCPSENAAVVGGNVLVSQRVTDVVLMAFGAAAASQGCMNNFTMGDKNIGYYETIAGGSGAGPDWDGASGVHTHMTNTRITDPEILEQRYPVRLRKFLLRKGSGGVGLHPGGEGVEREIEVTSPLTVSILSERRVHRPWGLNGGGDGACGENYIVRKDGREIFFGGKNTAVLEPGDAIRICTPGGGGFGPPL
uniref:Hydantoinase B/oxoprolinase domain-containing protein n=2 Tax=Rhodosorus marinus TaxID=101924 RepID=A0A7S0G1G6_9RHOD|mmetsp:Transcript_13276/g.19144  ORF Transcript_13276/g.19144 Transcript_13276/m.19144 type:complete len:321 (+) Transcript_13276:979-1941(+)